LLRLPKDYSIGKKRNKSLPLKTIKVLFKFILGLLAILLIAVLVMAAILFIQINRSDGEVITSGQARKYLLHVPAGYDPSVPTPLVISIHGYAEWPAHQMQLSRWNDLADQENIIVVYPSGSDFPLRWRTNGLGDSMLDVQFISDLLDDLEMDYNIDPLRIYANGLSNGGGMSFLLACKLSDRIAAFGGISGAYVLDWENCYPDRPVPGIIFHGTADPIVPFEGGPSESFDVPFPNIPTWVRQLAEKNGCNLTPDQLPAQGDVSGKGFQNCDQNANVDFYVIDGGGHSWPGGDPLPEWIVGYTSDDIDTTRVMWNFFQAHRMENQ
jgi:polyhydroxybutyrate depolymerase